MIYDIILCMKYIYLKCDICKKEDRDIIDFQAYYCTHCQKFYDSSLSESTSLKMKLLGKYLIVLRSIFLALIGGGYLFPNHRTPISFSLLMTVLFIFYINYSLRIKYPEDKILRTVVDLNKFKEKMKIYNKKDTHLIILYLSGIFLGYIISIYFGWHDILFIVVPFVIYLIYLPWKRIKNAKNFLI